MILRDQLAIVTGAGSGIGHACAQALAIEGATVVVVDRSRDAVQRSAEEIRAAGGRAHAVIADVTDDAQLASLVDTALEHGPRIHVLHSHVGVQVKGTLEQVDVVDMDRSWGINVRSHFLLCQKVVPHMVASGGGSVIVTASNSGVLYDRQMIAYATTKHAVVAMVRQMALDYAEHGVRINALCPGWVDTPFNEPFIAQMGGREAIESYVRGVIPMGRWGRAEEIAEAALFLASHRSSFMTGQALVVDGGESLAAG